MGKIIAASMPGFIFPPARFDIMPTRVGPLEQPKSPARASIANIAVPPVRSDTAALLKVPGHIIPTESPHNPQPIRLMIGDDVRLASK